MPSDGVGSADPVSLRFECGDCGGDLRLVEHVATDASATESYDCVDCGATGDVLWSHDPDSPKLYGSVVES